MAPSNVDSSVGFNYEIVLFNGNNYHSWKFQMKMVLMSKGLWSIVTGTDAEPQGPGVTEREKQNWKNRQDIAYSTIALAVEPKQQTYVPHTDNAKKAWDDLAKRFETKITFCENSLQKTTIFSTNGEQRKCVRAH